MKRFSIALGFVCLSYSALTAKEYYIDSRHGDDAAAGTSLKLLGRAFELRTNAFKPGDEFTFTVDRYLTGSFARYLQVQMASRSH